MKKVLTLYALLFGVFAGSYAQQIKKNAPVFDDYLPLLQQAGYNVFTYDISALKDTTYNITFIIREYAAGKHLQDKDLRIGLRANRYMLAEFDEADRAQAIADGIAEDAANGVFRLATKIGIGFTPSQSDTLQNILFRAYGKEPLAQSGSRVVLRDVRMDNERADNESRNFIRYTFREFKEEPFATDTFIPLLMYASFWWDAEHNIYRFCGDSELTRDMSSSLLKDSPHYYIIGVEFNKQ